MTARKTQSANLSGFPGEDLDMARRRWQQGQLYQQGRYWKVRYYEDYITTDGQLARRKARPVNIGPCVGPGKLTEKQALKRKAEVMAEVNENSHHPQSIMTVSEFVETKFRPQYIILCKPAGRKHYEYLLSAHILPALGDMQLRDVKPDHVRALIAAKSRSYSRQTLKHIKTTLRTLIQHAKDGGHFTGENPAAVRMRLPEGEARRVQAYTWEEAKQILDHLPTPIWEMVLLSTATSLNVAELCGIRVKRVNLSPTPALIDGEVVPGLSVAIRENFYEGKYGSLKAGKRRRNVPIPPVLTPKLAALCEKKEPDHPLFANQSGLYPVDAHNTTNRLFRNLSQQLGVKVNWHRFRHTHATFTDEMGMDPADRQALLGHGSRAMTDWYTHPFERQRAGANAIAEKLLERRSAVM
jgi:integrase